MTRKEWEWRSAAGMVRRFARRPETDPVRLKWMAIERQLRRNKDEDLVANAAPRET
jgi:hypothetical protein